MCPSRVRQPFDIRLQEQLDTLRARIERNEAALRQLYAYRSDIPDRAYHDQVDECKKEIHESKEIVRKLQKLKETVMRPTVVGSEPTVHTTRAKASLSPSASPQPQPQSPIIHPLAPSVPVSSPCKTAEDLTSLSNWLQTVKQDFALNKIPCLPEIEIPSEYHGAYFADMQRIAQQVQDLEGKLPMLFLLFKEAENVRGLAILTVLIQHQCVLLQSAPPRFVVTLQYLDVIKREVAKALGRYEATVGALKSGIAVS